MLDIVLTQMRRHTDSTGITLPHADGERLLHIVIMVSKITAAYSSYAFETMMVML